MLNRALQLRIERAELVAKAQSKHSAECLCFPENEPPFFAFEIELEMLTRVKCPLHGRRFKPLYRIFVAKWLRAKQPHHLWTHHSEQYRKAMVRKLSPELVASRGGRGSKWADLPQAEGWNKVASFRANLDAKGLRAAGRTRGREADQAWTCRRWRNVPNSRFVTD